MTPKTDPVQPDTHGLHCPLGGFHVDPWRTVPLAIVTHAHADHAVAGCDRYLASIPTAALLRSRLGESIPVETLDFGHSINLGKTRVSLHPAGHVLGSAQVRIEHTAGVCCITGDFKPTPDGYPQDTTAEPFELVTCDLLITESTFALPIYRWPDPAQVARKINSWRAENTAAGRTSVLLGYSLGKAQRILSILDPTIGPIGVHGSIDKLNTVYRAHGIALPTTLHANKENAPQLKGATILAPPSVVSTGGSTWLRQFAGPEGIRTAMVSGWMTIRGRRRWRSNDTGFVLSDHADWDGLLNTIRATGATRVGVTHGSVEPFARYLQEQVGLDAFIVPTRYRGEDSEDSHENQPHEELPSS